MNHVNENNFAPLMDTIVVYLDNSTVSMSADALDEVCTGLVTSAGLVIDYQRGVPPIKQLASLLQKEVTVTRGVVCLSSLFNLQQILRAFIMERNMDILRYLVRHIRRLCYQEDVVLCEQTCRDAVGCLGVWLDELSSSVCLLMNVGIRAMDVAGARLALESAQLADFVGFHSSLEVDKLVSSVHCFTNVLDYRFKYPGRVDVPAGAPVQPASSPVGVVSLSQSSVEVSQVAESKRVRRSPPCSAAHRPKRQRQEEEMMTQPPPAPYIEHLTQDPCAEEEDVVPPTPEAAAKPAADAVPGKMEAADTLDQWELPLEEHQPDFSDLARQL